MSKVRAGRYFSPLSFWQWRSFAGHCAPPVRSLVAFCALWASGFRRARRYHGLAVSRTAVDDTKILSFCGGTSMIVTTGWDIWSHNKKAIGNYAPNGKDLKLIWEAGGPITESIIKMFEPLQVL